jgi:asparagine synthetase B (glutamine-hydrolysing)
MGKKSRTAGRWRGGSVDSAATVTDDGGVRTKIDGRLFGRERLNALVASWGHAPPPDGDPALVTLLYCRYGVDLVHAIDGEFALEVADEEAGKTLLARDRFGCLPCRDLPPAGRVLLQGKEAAQPERYWRLPERTEPGGESEDELVAELSRLLAAAIAVRLEDRARVAVVGDGVPAALLAALTRRRSVAVDWVDSVLPDGADPVLGTAGAAELLGGTAMEPRPDPSGVPSPYLDYELAEFAMTVPARLLGLGNGSLLALALRAAENG